MNELKQSNGSLNQLNAYIYFAKTGFYTDSRWRAFKASLLKLEF